MRGHSRLLSAAYPIFPIVFSNPSDVFDCMFQAQAIELFHWQVARQVDSLVGLLRYLPEVIIRFFVVALKFCRIRQRSMRDNRLAGAKRTMFFGVVTHCDDKSI